MGGNQSLLGWIHRLHPAAALSCLGEPGLVLGTCVLRGEDRDLRCFRVVELQLIGRKSGRH